MRVFGTAAIVALVFGIAALVALTITGHLPWAAKQASAIASALPAPSVLFAPDPPTDAGPVDAAPDAPPVKPQAAPLSSAQLAAPLYGVTFLAECGAPPSMKVTVKVTVKLGRATDVQAKCDPPDPGIEACIERAVSALHWDPSKKAGKFTVHY